MKENNHFFRRRSWLIIFLAVSLVLFALATTSLILVLDKEKVSSTNNESNPASQTQDVATAIRKYYFSKNTNKTSFFGDNVPIFSPNKLAENTDPKKTKVTKKTFLNSQQIYKAFAKEMKIDDHQNLPLYNAFFLKITTSAQNLLANAGAKTIVFKIKNGNLETDFLNNSGDVIANPTNPLAVAKVANDSDAKLLGFTDLNDFKKGEWKVFLLREGEKVNFNNYQLAFLLNSKTLALKILLPSPPTTSVNTEAPIKIGDETTRTGGLSWAAELW